MLYITTIFTYSKKTNRIEFFIVITCLLGDILLYIVFVYFHEMIFNDYLELQKLFPTSYFGSLIIIPDWW